MKKKTSSKIFLTSVSLGLFCLAACGGGNSSSQPSAAPAFVTAANSSAQLLQFIDNSIPSSPASMPNAGSANYIGMGSFGASSDDQVLKGSPDYIADVSLTVDFAAAVVTGNFDNFAARDGRKLSGTLVVSNGVLSEENFLADAKGSLFAASSTQTIDGVIVGQLFGTNQDAIGGGFAGNRTSNGTADVLYGAFGAQKQ